MNTKFVFDDFEIDFRNQEKVDLVMFIKQKKKEQGKYMQSKELK